MIHYIIIISCDSINHGLVFFKWKDWMGMYSSMTFRNIIWFNIQLGILHNPSISKVWIHSWRMYLTPSMTLMFIHIPWLMHGTSELVTCHLIWNLVHCSYCSQLTSDMLLWWSDTNMEIFWNIHNLIWYVLYCNPQFRKGTSPAALSSWSTQQYTLAICLRWSRV